MKANTRSGVIGVLFGLTSLVLINPASGQNKFNYLVEAGLNGSSLPTKDKGAVYGRSGVYMFFSPVAGIYLMPKSKSSFSLSIGTQIFRQGYRYRRHSYFPDPINHLYSTYDERDYKTTTTIAIPIQLKYSFNIWKVRINIYAGGRLLNYIQGSYYYLNQTKYDHDIGLNSFEEKSFSMFSDDLVVKMSRHNFQINAGVGVMVAKRFEIYATVNKLTRFSNDGYFEEKRPPNVAWDYTGHWHWFNPIDFSLSVRYSLNKVDNKEE